MGQTTAKIRTTKRQTQAERDEAIRREAFGNGYQVGLAAGFADGLVEGGHEVAVRGHVAGRHFERLHWTKRSLWTRLRYLINPNYVG